MKGINITEHLHGKQFQTTQQTQNYCCGTMRHEHTALCSLGEQILVSLNWKVKKKKKRVKIVEVALPSAERRAQMIDAKRGMLRCIHPQYTLSLSEKSRQLTIPHIQGRKNKSNASNHFPFDSTNLPPFVLLKANKIPPKISTTWSLTIKFLRVIQWEYSHSYYMPHIKSSSQSKFTLCTIDY